MLIQVCLAIHNVESMSMEHLVDFTFAFILLVYADSAVGELHSLENKLRIGDSKKTWEESLDYCNSFSTTLFNWEDYKDVIDSSTMSDMRFFLQLNSPGSQNGFWINGRPKSLNDEAEEMPRSSKCYGLLSNSLEKVSQVVLNCSLRLYPLCELPETVEEHLDDISNGIVNRKKRFVVQGRSMVAFDVEIDTTPRAVFDVTIRSKRRKSTTKKPTSTLPTLDEFFRHTSTRGPSTVDVDKKLAQRRRKAKFPHRKRSKMFPRFPIANNWWW